MVYNVIILVYFVNLLLFFMQINEYARQKYRDANCRQVISVEK
jgi:hypothetical protein